MSPATTRTAEEIRNLLLASLGDVAPEADPATIDPARNLREQLDLDSMDFLNFVIAVHKRLGIEIPESEYPKLASLDGAVAYLQGKGI